MNTKIKMNQLVLIPIHTNVSVNLNVNAKQTFTHYLHHMRVFLQWENHEPVSTWTIDVPKHKTDYPKYITSLLRNTETKPSYIKRIKSIKNVHVYALVYTGFVSPTEFPSIVKCNNSEWRWKNYICFYSPWEEDDTHKLTRYNPMESSSESEVEEETIQVFDYILEEKMNPFDHSFPLSNGENLKMKEICESLSAIEAI